ncbi:TetR/AcrR family transcriptional regulator [Microvirga lotononidis]|uniref:Transcriptional regulator n=1 Tax=Microvirga lotononidis TaxID=864069 RepID=I4YR62_9HYPH|nr:TetR/AcrR family transcriptional regulator [Microvirga lotononidis]EIM26454.1 transcriptional regulator [Microvirga lotononidis]WQO30811.1 TetR/AcrR family transcriptional regulator [Microvirga lotononidis]
MADLINYSEENVRRAGKRDPQASRQALLTAAIAEFAAKGPAGARVDEIARRAGVNKQMVYHYFGNKDDLFQAALEEVYGRIRARERALNLSDLPPVRAMESLVGFSFDYLAEHPEFIALLNDENRNGAMHLDGLREVQTMHLPLVELIRDALQRGVREGVFRDDVDPINLYISIAGLSYFFFSNNRTLSAIFGTNLGDSKAVAVRRRHVIEFALGALRPLQP